MALWQRCRKAANRSVAPTASMATRTPLTLWLETLSMTTMSPDDRLGARTFSTYAAKDKRKSVPGLGRVKTFGWSPVALIWSKGSGVQVFGGRRGSAELFFQLGGVPRR